MDVRIQKFLAQAGVGARRACDALVADGRVRVDGVVAEPGTRIDPSTAVVEVDGVRVHADHGLVVLMLNKPAGMVTTMSDDRGRPCVGDLVRDHPQRLFHVGRLDEDTEGLLLLTNDGDLAHLLMHPSHGVSKTYVARVRGDVGEVARRRLLEGIRLEDGFARADAVMVKAHGPASSVVQLVLHEGRKRIVRRMLKAVGHPVTHLTRTVLGPLQLTGLASGEYRELSAREISDLRQAARLQ